MFPISKMTSLVLAGILCQPLPCLAIEHSQSLLSELSRSTTSRPSRGDATGLVSPAERQGDDVPGLVSELFSLEEIRGKAAESGELELPDIDLPLSDIPLTLNNRVESFLYYFQTRGKSSFSRWLSRSSRYIPMMKDILKSKGLPEDLVYVAMIESGFHLQACSWANAVGPWQFISETGRRYSLRIDQWVDERKDPVKATTAAALYLKELYGMFKGDWYLAAAGYNAGENKILRAIDMYNTNDFWELSRGSYLKRETKDYVPKLLAAAIIAKEPARYGFYDVAYLPPIEFDTVSVPSRLDLELAARLTGTSYQAIKELNPDLRHWCTPPNYPDYVLKLPKGTRQRFEAGLAAIPIDQRFTEKPLYTRYQAREQDSLDSVARRFDVSTDALTQLNGFSRSSRVAGKSLIVPAKQTVDFKREGRMASAGGVGDVVYTKYRVAKKSDTLASVARRFHVSPQALLQLNGLSKKSPIFGRSLIIPVTQKVASVQSARGTSATKRTLKGTYARYHVVKKGDTLESIARKFKVSARLISTWNNLKGKIALKPGRRIIVALFTEKNGEMIPVASKG